MRLIRPPASRQVTIAADTAHRPSQALATYGCGSPEPGCCTRADHAAQRVPAAKTGQGRDADNDDESPIVAGRWSPLNIESEHDGQRISIHACKVLYSA